MRLPATIIVFFLTALSLFAETELRIVGSQSMSEEESIRLIGGRLEYVRSQPASPSRASDAAFLVEQLFQLNGFNNAVVYWKILSPSLIRLRIDEGSRDLLGAITIIGVDNPKLHKLLIDLFQLNPRKRAGGGTNKLPLRDEDVDTGLDLMNAEMKSLGFWKSEISVTHRQLNPETGRIDFTITIDAGLILRIAPPTFAGEHTEGLKQVAAPYIGQPSDTPRVNGLRSEVTDYYRSRGFIDAKIRMTLEIVNNKVQPAFTITKGKRFRLGKIKLEGLQKTNPERVSVRIKTMKGHYIDGDTAEKRIRELIATGAFSSLRTERIPQDNDVLDITLHFEEAAAKGISYKLGFDSYEGGIVGASYYDRNFRGEIRNFRAGIELTGRAILGEISLTDPWLYGSDARGNLRLYSITKNHEGYDNWRSGLQATVSYPVSDHYRLDFALGWAFVKTTEDGILPWELGERNYQNPYLLFNQRFDYRNNKMNPTKGWYLDIPFEIGGAFGDQSTHYLKAGFSSAYYHSLGKSGLLALGARSGLLIPNGGSRRLPIDLRYFTGGSRSVRSYHERELGPWSISGYPTGGEAYWVANIEYIHSLAGPLQGVVFVDAGGLSSNWEDFGFNQPAVALGLGIRLNLPIGPVRLEYGHNLIQQARGPTGTWHFAIGTAF